MAKRATAVDEGAGSPVGALSPSGEESKGDGSTGSARPDGLAPPVATAQHPSGVPAGAPAAPGPDEAAKKKVREEIAQAQAELAAIGDVHAPVKALSAAREAYTHRRRATIEALDREAGEADRALNKAVDERSVKLERVRLLEARLKSLRKQA